MRHFNFATHKIEYFVMGGLAQVHGVDALPVPLNNVIFHARVRVARVRVVKKSARLVLFDEFVELFEAYDTTILLIHHGVLSTTVSYDWDAKGAKDDRDHCPLDP